MDADAPKTAEGTAAHPETVGPASVPAGRDAGPTAHAAHPSFLAHHFDTPLQQHNASKLGMWLFLVTEILMFSGLFCAYSVYRMYHPEIFRQASHFLNWKLGALNTLVLICSSLTIAWAVRCAQRNQQRALVALLAITIACGGVFMAVKAVEYHDKWKHHLLPGTRFQPELAHQPEVDAKSGAAPTKQDTPKPAADLPKGLKADPYLGPTGGDGPRGLAPEAAAPAHVEKLPPYAHVFFSIYFLMTGLHGLHVLIGMGVITWILLRARRGEFSSEYYTPVDLVGLYWHLVDIIWIYLFPLLYLIR
jgi:cytochrome c oxidase subunit 3